MSGLGSCLTTNLKDPKSHLVILRCSCTLSGICSNQTMFIMQRYIFSLIGAHFSVSIKYLFQNEDIDLEIKEILLLWSSYRKCSQISAVNNHWASWDFFYRPIDVEIVLQKQPDAQWWETRAPKGNLCRHGVEPQARVLTSLPPCCPRWQIKLNISLNRLTKMFWLVRLMKIK